MSNLLNPFRFGGEVCDPLNNCGEYDDSGPDYVKHADDPLLDFNGAHTVIMWIKPDSTQSDDYGTFFAKRDNSNFQTSINYRRTTETIEWYVTDSGPATRSVTGVSLTADAWNLVQFYFDPGNTEIGVGVGGGTFGKTTNAGLTSLKSNVHDFLMGLGHNPNTVFKGKIGAPYVCMGTVFNDWTKTYDHNNSATPLAKCELHADVQAAITVGWENEDDLVTDVEGGLSDLTPVNTPTLVAI